MKRQLIKPPDTYLGVVVPDNIKRAWCTWEGVQWRICRHADRGVLQPPDQRFSLTPPEALCAVHRRHWYRWRNRHFAGVRFPGPGAGDGFLSPYMAFEQSWAWCRWEWDEQTRQQMRQAEEICLSGRSTQCESRRISSDSEAAA